MSRVNSVKVVHKINRARNTKWIRKGERSIKGINGTDKWASHLNQSIGTSVRKDECSEGGNWFAMGWDNTGRGELNFMTRTKMKDHDFSGKECHDNDGDVKGYFEKISIAT